MRVIAKSICLVGNSNQIFWLMPARCVVQTLGGKLVIQQTEPQPFTNSRFTSAVYYVIHSSFIHTFIHWTITHLANVSIHWFKKWETPARQHRYSPCLSDIYNFYEQQHTISTLLKVTGCFRRSSVVSTLKLTNKNRTRVSNEHHIF